MAVINVRAPGRTLQLGDLQFNHNSPVAAGLLYFVLTNSRQYKWNFATESSLTVTVDAFVTLVPEHIQCYDTVLASTSGQVQYTLSKSSWVGSYAVGHWQNGDGNVPWMFASDTEWDGLYSSNDGSAILTSSAGFGGSVNPGTSMLDGTWQRNIFSIPAVNNFRGARNLTDIAVDTTAALPISAMTKLVLGGDYSQANQTTTRIQYFAVWDRVLSDYEMREFNAAPFQALEKRRRVFYFTTAGGGATTINADGLAQAQLLGSPTLTQHNILAVNGITQAQLLGQPTLTQAHILVVQGVAQGQALGEPSLTQHNALTPDAVTQAQTLANISLIAGGSLAAHDIAQAQSLGSPSLTQHHVLAVAALMQAQVLGQPDIAQAGALAVQSLTQAQLLGAPGLTQHNILVVQGMTLAQVLDAVALVQHHALAVQGLLQGQSLGNITLTASDALAIDGLTHAQILGAPSLTQHNVLAVQSMTHAQILQAVTLGGLVIGSLRGTLVAYSLLDGEVVCRALLSGSPTTVH